MNAILYIIIYLQFHYRLSFVLKYILDFYQNIASLILYNFCVESFLVRYSYLTCVKNLYLIDQITDQN